MNNLLRKCVCCHHKYDKMRFFCSGMGSEDLDKRRPRQKGYTDMNLEECKYCGYVAYDLSEFTIVNRMFLYSRRYKSCAGIKFKSQIAERYYKRYMLIQSFGIFCSVSDCFDLLLRAAWCCDDANDKENAVICRRKALHYLETMILFTFKRNEKEELLLIQSDIMRRAKLFDKVVKKFEGMPFHNKLYNDTVRFQVAKAKDHDDVCYRFSDVPTRENVTFVSWMT